MIDIEKIEILGCEYVLKKEILSRSLNNKTILTEQLDSAVKVQQREYDYLAFFVDETNSNLLVYNTYFAEVEKSTVVESIIALAKKCPNYFSSNNNVICILDIEDDGRVLLGTIYKGAYKPEEDEFKPLEKWHKDIFDDETLYTCCEETDLT